MIDEIRQWKPDDMDNTATHFNELASKRYDTMAAIKAADTAEWTGAGGEGKDIAIAQHAAAAAEQAEMFRATASVATEGSQALYGLQQQLVETLDTAKNSAWKVDDSGQVSDLIQDPWVRAARQPVGATLQSTVLTQAAAFHSQQAVTASGLAPDTFMLDNTSGGADSQACKDAVRQAEQDRENQIKWAAGIGLAGGAVAGPESALAGAFGMGALGALWYQYTHKALPGACQ